MAYNYSNNFSTTLGAAIVSTGATSITVASSTGAPSVNFPIYIDTEMMLVTSVSGTTWTVTRGVEGTSAATHLNGATVNNPLTAASLQAVPMAGDVTGAANASTIFALASSAIVVGATVFTVANTAGSFSYSISPLVSTSGGSGTAGVTTSITGQAGQAATGAAHNGGNGGPLNLSSGAGGTSGSATPGTAGALAIQVGGTTVFNFASTTSVVPGTDNSVSVGSASKRWADAGFVNAHFYPTSGATVASLIFQSVGALTSGSNINGGSIWFYDSTGSDTNSGGLTHTANGSEVCFQDLFSNTAAVFTMGGTPVVTIAAATMHWNNGINTTANANCVFDYPAQASVNANGAVGGTVIFSTQPGQPCSGNSHTAGAGGAATYKSSAGGATSGTGSGVVAGAAGTTTLGGDAGGAGSSSTAGTGGKGGSIVAVAGTGGNGGSSTGTSGAGGDFTFGSGAFGATGNTKGANGTVTFKVAGTNIWTYQTTPALVYSTPTVATSGTTTLTAAQYLLQGIDFGTVTLVGAATVVFPNSVGTWFVDVSRVTLGANTLTLQSGSGTLAITTLSTTSGMLVVRCTGSNGISA